MASGSKSGMGDAPLDARVAAPSRLPVRPAFVLLLLFFLGATFTSDLIAAVLLRVQDFWLLAIVFFATILSQLPFRHVERPLSLDARGVALIALSAAALTFAGHYYLLSGYDFTRDEQMANFDAAIFRSGRLAWPLSPAWQAHAQALNLRFMLPVAQPVAWVSAYLPMHALIRAALGAFTGPMLTALSVPLLWACARRLWPEQRETATVCVLLFVSAGQVLFTSMTAYAMPAHLFCNLLWLWLFLRDRRASDLAALLLGFVGTGLHQPLFHPMFVAPFMLLLLAERRWMRLALFVPAYALIGLFWLYWPIYMHGLVAGSLTASPVPNADYVTRLIEALGANRDNLTTMADNMLRFCTWQNLLLLPLMLASWPAIRRTRFAAALALGLLLPALVMVTILPSQGHGFGYRYFHGVLGNALLLAGYGWNTLAAEHPALRSTLLRAVAVSLLLLLPVQTWMTHRLYAPFAEASARIDASGADYAIIRDGHMMMSHDLVLNRPDLSNRPIRLLDPLLGDLQALARLICRPGVRVAIAGDGFFRPLTASLGLPDAAPNGSRIAEEATALRAAGCTVTALE
jgi:hypothetical protein